nr:hypothetical protein [Tanacetum cinerariifolium]
MHKTPYPIKGVLSDSYDAPKDDAATGTASEGFAKKKGRTVAVTTEDIQKRRNDVKARTTLLLALPDEHQLRFSKYKTAQELWAAILKTFGGNEATRKIKKNLLKQQYDNFKDEGKETLEQTFNRLQAIVSHLEFMDIEIESDLDTISLDDLHNHLKVYEHEVHKKSDSHNMAFISLAKNSSGNGKLTLLIDEDDIEVMDIKWNMDLLSMRADRYWKKTGKKISIQGINVAGLDKSKVECFNCHKMGHFARECRAPKSQGRGRRENFKQGSKVEEQAPKALMAIDRGNSQNNINDKGYWDTGCSQHITGNISYLSDYEPYDEGYVSFGQGGCKITGTDSKHDVWSRCSEIHQRSNHGSIEMKRWCVILTGDPLEMSRVSLEICGESSKKAVGTASFVPEKLVEVVPADTTGPVDTPVQTKTKSKEMEEQSFIATIHQKTDPTLLQFFLFLCFLSQEEPKKIFDALKDPSWVEAMQEELLQFKIQNPPGFQDPKFPARVYKVEKAMYELHQAPRAWHRGDFILVQVYVDDIIFGSSNPLLCREFRALMHEKFQMSVMGELNFFLGLSANTPMDKENPWGKNRIGKDVDLHLYRSMIGSLMYLTASRPDIMFAVCAYARHQVTPKECHLYAVKRMFRYLKGHPKLRLWYPKESPFDLVAYSDSDYGGATQDRKSTTRGC